ncbi:MAG: hypothetical protein ACOYON_08325 [Fimbriimonas sp.]
MKKFLTLMALAGAMIGMNAVSMAQAPGPRGGGGFQGGPGGQGGPSGGWGGRAKKMQEIHEKILGQLGLNKDQKTKVKALDEKRAKKREETMKEMMAKGPAGMDRDAMRASMKKEQDAYKEELAKILTKPQMKKYEELTKAEREKMRKEMGGMGGPGGPGRGGKGGGR